MPTVLSAVTSGRILFVLTSATMLVHLVLIAQLPSHLNIYIPGQIVKATSLAFAVTIIFLTSNWKTRGHQPRQNELTVDYVDMVLIGAILLSSGYIAFFHENVLDYGFYGALDGKGVIFALCIVIPLLEAVRRKIGIVLPVIILLFVAIAMFQQYLPGVLNGPGYSLQRLLYSSYVGEAGIFGKPLSIAVEIIIVFLFFGTLMERAGASRWFMDLALAVTGWSRGGPAKSAVVASAFFGSISGSPSSNSAVTGVITIPLMKDAGYKPRFAAAVEAVASSGGMILPPVMGAIAFLMADWIGLTYVDVVIAAAIPAALYFIIVFVSVHLEARASNLEAWPHASIPNVWRTLRTGWHFALPLFALIWFLLVKAYPPGLAGIYSCVVVIACSFLSNNRDNWLTPGAIGLAAQDAVLRWLAIAVITGSVGIMIGALELSGVGINISRFIIDVGQGNLLLTLLLVGMASLVVGMGLDATPAYVTLATLLAPALIQMGVPPIAAHFYVVYWGLASFFTPPTCIAIFVTAPIAGAPVWGSGFEAMRLGFAAFLVPFAFVLHPALLMMGDPGSIVVAVTTTLIGSLSLAASLRGFAINRLLLFDRILMGAGGILTIIPGWSTTYAGLAAILLAIAISAWRSRRHEV